MIYIDDCDNLAEDLEKKSKFIENVGDFLTDNKLMMNDWKQKIQYPKDLNI